MPNKYLLEALYRVIVILAVFLALLGIGFMFPDGTLTPSKSTVIVTQAAGLLTAIGWFINYRYSKKLEWVVRTQIPGNYSKLSVSDLLELNKYGFNYKIAKPEES